MTGIFKTPHKEPVFLDVKNVRHDTVADRKHHGGHDKACYLFSADHYPYWKEKYPDLDWDWGMFGENLTVENMVDSQLRIGDIFQIGGATVQVTMPRQPCYKLGHRFGDMGIIKAFVAHENPGTYVRILEKGEVRSGDSMKLVHQGENDLKLVEYFKMCYARDKDPVLVAKALANPAFPEYKKVSLRKDIKKGA